MSKRRNTKDFKFIYCPFCTKIAAQADPEAQSGFSRAHKKGKVRNLGNHMTVRCGECGEEWLCAELRFRGWQPGQELGASSRMECRKPGLQPAQIAVQNAKPDEEEE